MLVIYAASSGGLADASASASASSARSWASFARAVRNASWVRFLRVVGAALLVVLIQADWTQRKLRDYFLRPLARITNRVSPRGYQTYDWEE